MMPLSFREVLVEAARAVAARVDLHAGEAEGAEGGGEGRKGRGEARNLGGRDFDAGEVVDIECAGVLVAKGCPDYGSEDINRIRGMRSDVAKNVLGAKMKYKDAVRSENIALMP